MISNQRRGSARALYLEVIAHDAGWEVWLPEPGEYLLALVTPAGFDEGTADKLMERVKPFKPQLIAILLGLDNDGAAVIQEARR